MTNVKFNSENMIKVVLDGNESKGRVEYTYKFDEESKKFKNVETGKDLSIDETPSLYKLQDVMEENEDVVKEMYLIGKDGKEIEDISL